MATKKYQVFVSSTFRDLVDERQDTIRSILDLNHIPAGMELFPAADVEQLEYIKKVIDECDYYLLIVGGRYGSLDAEGVGYTEREYDYAVSTGKFVIAFVHGSPEAIPVGKSDVEPAVAKALIAFKEKVMKGRLVREWTSRQHLETVVVKSLSYAFSHHPQIGWIRGNAAASQETLEQANAALRENAQLRAELAQAQAVTVEKFENLADLNDQFVVRYTYAYRSSNGKTTYPETNVNFTWKQLFVAIASRLSTPRTDAIIHDALKMLAKDLNLRTPSLMNSTDLVTIKVQLIAHGLISARVSGTTEGKTAEFLSLTDKGNRVFMASKVVKKT